MTSSEARGRRRSSVTSRPCMRMSSMPGSCRSRLRSSRTTWQRLALPGTSSPSMRGSRTSRRSSGSCFAIPTSPSRIPGLRTACGEPRMVSIRTSPGIGPWARPSSERSKITFAVRGRGRGLPPEGPNGVPACGRSMDRAGRAHVLGFVVVLGVALLLHYGLLPVLGRRVGIRETPAYFLAVALVPVALWLIPAFSRALARGAFEAHRKLFGKGGVYVRLPGSEPIRLRDTLLMSIGPFAIDVLVMAEILFLQGAADLRQLVVGFVAFPILLLAGLLTSLLPGAWLLDALDLRLVNPARGEVIRPAEWFERTLGPVGAVAFLAGFVTLLHTSGYSYESALFLLGLWAVRLFPAVFGAVCVYRLVIEPQVLPTLEAWCSKQGIEIRTALPNVLTEWAAAKAENPPRSPS